MEDEKKGKIIQFPNKNGASNTNIKIDNVALEIHHDLKYADHLTEGLVVNLIHNLSENGIDTTDEDFIKSLAFLIELVKSMIYNNLGVDHPMQGLVDIFVSTGIDKSGGSYSHIDLDGLTELIDNYYDEEDVDE
tara:strand:- start:974 stop:1375 length:402 start_codon:yes stop_codon:yes gene_type:complete